MEIEKVIYSGEIYFMTMVSHIRYDHIQGYRSVVTSITI